jgi:hypothetical protein
LLHDFISEDALCRVGQYFEVFFVQALHFLTNVCGLTKMGEAVSEAASAVKFRILTWQIALPTV